MQDKIIELITRYGKLNKIYTTIVTNGYIDFENQMFVTDFYLQNINNHSYGDYARFFLETDTAKVGIILNVLKKEIDKNIILYQTNRELFDTLDIDAVCQRHSNQFNHRIDELLRIVNESHEPVKEANGVLEALGFREHTAEEEALWEQTYQIAKREYEEAKKPLNELYCQQKQAKKEAIRCNRNCFNDIYNFGKHLSTVLENYIQENLSKTPIKQNDVQTEDLIPMKLLCDIHAICNGKQFEEISERDFCKNMNIIPTKTKLKVRKGETVRVCCLIGFICEYGQPVDPKDWTSKILDLLGISEKTYNSKYREPISDTTNEANRCFIDEIRGIAPYFPYFSTRKN